MALPDSFPSGAMVPQEDEDLQGQDQTTEAPVEQTKEELILGKFKTPDDAYKAYQELETMSGRQSSEVGDLRKQNEFLMRQLDTAAQQGRQSQTQQAQQAPDFDTQIAQIQQQVETGDIDISQALKMSSEITAQKALHLAQQEFAKQRQQETAQSLQSKFLQENPDFEQLRASGTLAQIRQQNPIHDDLSAYQQYKIQQLQAQMEEVKKSGYEQGRSEVTKLAEGSEAARKTLAKPGSDIRKTTNAPGKPMSPSEMKASMMARIQGM